LKFATFAVGWCQIRLRHHTGGDVKVVTPEEFERLGGHAARGKWLESCRIQMPDSTVGPPVGVWLRRKGASWGHSVVNHRISVFWPEDRRYYSGTYLL
jgi:hypothetical protein